jgi:hypothetical protein
MILGLLALPVLALALAAGTVLLALEDQPRVVGTPVPDAQTVRHLRDWLRQHNPRRQRDGRPIELRATAADLALLAGQGARLVGGSATTRLGEGRLEVELSLPFRGRWINLRAELGDGPDLPPLHRLEVGRLVLPGPLAEAGARLALRWWDRPQDQQRPLHHMLLNTRWSPQEAQVLYVWRADLPRRLAGWRCPRTRSAASAPTTMLWANCCNASRPRSRC